MEIVYALPIIGLVVLLSLLMKEKGETSTHISRGVVIGLGFFLLASGTALAASSGAMSALVIFSEHQINVQTDAITALNMAADPIMISGYADMALGAVLLAFGITNKKK